jgi:HlyD family secretion protein
MAQERKQLDRRWLWAGALVLLVVVFMSVRSLTRERLQVRAMQVAHQPLASTVTTNGRVEPVTPYEVHSPLATVVKAVYVQPGDMVPAGKLLMVLDDLDARARLAAAESGVKAAQAALEAATHNGTREQQQGAAADITRARMDRDQAQRDLDSLLKLQATGAASPSEVAAARQRLDTASATLEASQTTSQGRYSPAEVERARAALSDAEASLTAARHVEEETQVHAPAAGTVYNVDVKPSEFAEAGKLLLQLADLRHLRVRAYFDEPDIGRLAVGQPAEIKWDALLGHVWHGHIERIPITVTTYTTRNVGEVLVKIDDVDGQLLPDTNVNVTVTTSSDANALTIPRDALHTENGKWFVFKIEKDELKRTPVVRGSINLTQVAILSGLKEGDWVATGTTSGQPLQEGVPIKEVR